MYTSLLLPWSNTPSPAEQAYRAAGLLRTQGTIFLLPPTIDKLRETFNAPPRPKSRMSAGAAALCKHFERGGYSADASKGRELHPFWKMPVGSNENRSAIAGEILEEMLAEALWRNVIWLHEGVAVYEIRNREGYGMRWTLDAAGGEEKVTDNHTTESGWKISKTTFRGFLEPIAGLDHELDGAQTPG